MTKQRINKIEAVLLFIPFILLSISGTVDANIVVYGCLLTQFLSFFVFYRLEKTFRINKRWGNLFVIIGGIFCYLYICALIGYSPTDSIRVTSLIFLNVFMLIVNCCLIKEKLLLVFKELLHLCFLFGCISVLFSVIGLLIGSGFQLLQTEDNEVIIVSYVNLGPIVIRQFAVQGGIINGNLGVASWFANPNVFSVISFITYTYSLLNKKWKYIPVGVLGIILGFSRAIIIMTIFVTYISFYKSMKRVGRTLFIGISAALLLFLFSYSSGFIIDFNGRQNMWSVLANYALNHYFMPSGLGTSSLILKSYGGLVLSAHNLYLNLMVETGLIGMLIFIICFAYVVRKSYLLYKESKSNELFILFLLIVSLLAIGITEVTMFTFSFFNYLLFYLIIVAVGSTNAIRETV